MVTDSGSNEVIRAFEHRKRGYRGRAEHIRELYELYEQIDKRQETGFHSIATSDARTAMDLGSHILSRHQHIDRIPWSVQEEEEKRLQNKAERFLSGNWRYLDHMEILRGNSWHQRRLASWMLSTGWYAMFIAMRPNFKGDPTPMAELVDPALVYPEWSGPDGTLGVVDLEFPITLAALRIMADQNGWGTDGLEGDGSDVLFLLNHWEARYNRANPGQPDILQGVYRSAAASPVGGESMQTFVTMRAWQELQPIINRTTDTTGGGFREIPILTGPVPGIELSMAYFSDVSDVLRRRGQGLLSSMKAEKDMVDAFLSQVLQDERTASNFQSTIVTQSPGGTENFEPEGLGGTVPIPDDTRISQPLVYNPQLGAKQFILQALESRIQRAGFSWTLFGQADSNLSGVAIERLNEWARARLGPYQILMQKVYEQADYIWLRDYRERWGGRNQQGTMRLQGVDARGGVDGGLFDEEFTPDEIPETRWVQCEVPLALAEDDMMKANIARALNPDIRMSPDYIRERVLKVQDVQLEARKAAEGRIEQSDFYVNTQVLRRLRQEANSAQARGDNLEAQMLAFSATQLMQSLMPQQGQGIPQGPNQGPPDAGGNMTNAGGGRPELSPENLPRQLGLPEAPGGAGALQQAGRNV